MVSISFGFLFIGKDGRDVKLLSDMDVIAKKLPQKSIIKCYKSNEKKYSLFAYYARFHDISMDLNPDNQRQYLLIRKEYSYSFEEMNYKKVDLETQSFDLYEKERIRYIIISFILLIPFSSFGQVNEMVYENPNIDSLESKNLYLVVDNLNFFKNNEFSSVKTRGYTLPGFRINPKLSLVLDNNILIEAGISLLKYWGGANTYPCYSYMDIPAWNSNDYQKGFHFLPYFRAQIMLKENLNIVFGNLYINNSHNLIYPLYNPELYLSSDPETGVQLLYDNKYFKSDLWINWQSFYV